MTKKNIMPVVVLTVICVIVAALLGGVNELTKGKIAENALKKEQASLIEVLPGASSFEEIKITAELNLPSTVKSAYKEASGKGHVLIMATSTSYSSEDMTISVGVSPEGKVTGVKLTNYKESKDFGKETYPQKYVGATSDTYADVEVVSGVTYSSNAFKTAIGDAISAASKLSQETSAVLDSPVLLSSNGENELPKTDAQLLALMEEMAAGATFTESELPVDAPDTLKKLYTISDGGYMVYVVVSGQYVPVATEGLVHIDANGDIKNIHLLSWIVGHGVEPGGFANGFVGKDVWHIDDVELVSGATVTAKDFRDAVSEALDIVTDMLGTRDESFGDLIVEMIPGAKELKQVKLSDNAPSTLNALYKDSSGKGYVAHIIVPGQYVPVATEALVYIGERGAVKDILLLKWIVGHGVGPGDFAEGFIGSHKGTVGDVELVSAATTTSADFRNAVSDTINFIVPESTGFRVLGIFTLVVIMAAIAIATAIPKIITRRRTDK